MIFDDRQESGRILAGKLHPLVGKELLVLAIPRGGVPVAYEVAKHLKAPLDIVITKKIPHPHNSEYAIGAVGENGVYLSPAASEISQNYLREVIEKLKAEIYDKSIELGQRDVRGSYKGCTVILVDDGIATGSSALAAIESLRKKEADVIILATPVASHEALALLRPAVTEVVALHMPDEFFAVGRFFRNFEQVTSAQVREILSKKVQ